MTNEDDHPLTDTSPQRWGYDVFRIRTDFTTEKIFIDQAKTLHGAVHIASNWVLSTGQFEGAWREYSNSWQRTWVSRSKRHGGYMEIVRNPWKRIE